MSTYISMKNDLYFKIVTVLAIIELLIMKCSSCKDKKVISLLFRYLNVETDSKLTSIKFVYPFYRVNFEMVSQKATR